MTRTGRRGVAGLAILSLAVGSFCATTLPAAAAEPTPAAETAVASVKPVRIEAETYTGSNNGTVVDGQAMSTKTESNAGASGGSRVANTYNGSEISYDAIDLGAVPLSTLTVRYIVNEGRSGINPSIDVYLDEKTPENKVAGMALEITGNNWETYGETTGDLLKSVSGVHKVILVMHVDPKPGQPASYPNYFGNVDYLEFAPESVPDTFLGTSDEWKYSDDGTDPSGDGSLSWTTADFDDAAWKEAPGPFGTKNGGTGTIGASFPITTTVNHYLDGTSQPTIPTYHFRTEVDITAGQLAQVEGLEATLTYDDAVRVYVNGEKVAGFVDDRVNGAANQNLAYAGNSGGDPVTSTFEIPAEALQPGENTIAVALYQDREASSDIYLDMKSLVPVVKNDGPVSAEISDIVLGVGATEAQRNLTWYSDKDVPQAVQFAKAADVVDGAFPATATTVETTKSGGTTSGEFFRDATLGGLEENTEYAYRVGSDADGWSPTYTFRTHAFTGDFSFLFFGDPQVGASGNLARDEAGWVDTVDVATQSYPDAELLFSAGDQVNSAPSEAEYDTFLKPEQLRSVPLVATNGNHDVGSKAYEQHFNVPNEDLTAGAGNDTSSGGDYWFIYKDVLFVDINSNSRDYASHNAFMEKVVAEHGDEAKWKVLAFHHSIYSVAAHVNDDDIKDRREKMPAEISKLGFDVVLMGHDHNYTRSLLIKDGQLADAKELKGQSKVEAKDGEVLYLTANSASGSKYYDTTAPDSWWISVMNQEKVRNYSVVEVTDGDITLRTLRSQANGTAKPVNSVVDEVTLTKDAAPELTVPADGEIAEGSDFDALAGVSAEDNVDGDLTAQIQVSGTVDTAALGAQTLTYSVTDARGNETTKDRIVTVVSHELATSVPTISGTAKVGSTLTAKPGTWTTGAKLAYQWLSDGKAIAKATASTYRIAAADAGHKLSVKVTGTLAGYDTASETSKATATVAKGTLAAATPTVSGSVKVGSTVTAKAGTWTSGAKLAYQWLRDGKAISKATATTYKIAAADAGHKLSVKVTGTLSGYDTAAKTSAATVVAKATLTAATPKIAGTATVGSTLKAAAGTWTKGTKLSYQWLRDGRSISKATASAYKLVASDAGHKVSVKVTGTLSGYTTASKTSAATKAVAKATLTAATPKVTGTAKVGSTLKATAGTWTKGAKLSFQWLRDGRAISRATVSSYKLVAADAGHRVSVKVTGTLSGYTTASKTSAATKAVAKATLATKTPTISGTTKVGSVVTAKPGTWTKGTRFVYQWLRDGKAIKGATKSTHTLVRADGGHRISVKVTGKLFGYADASKTSAAKSIRK